MSEALIKNTDRFTETRIDDEIIVMNLDSGDFFSLTDTARSIWELIDGQNGIDGIVAAVAQAYQAPADAIRDDVAAFVAELGAAGLVRC